MSRPEHLHQNILENMRDGVMALDFQGRITLFNPAAGEILGLDGRKTRSRTFAEVFLVMDEANDEFNQVVLDAVQQKGVGRQDTVEFRRPGGVRVTLSVTSSYLREEQDDSARGVIVVFSDITQVKQLQEQEREQNRKLGKAYADLEETNSRLTQALKKVQAVRLAAAVGIVLLFAGLGLYHLQVFSGLKQMTGRGEPPAEAGRIETAAHVLTPRPLAASISLSGRLQPLEEVVVTAPFEGSILENRFMFGQRVQAGDVLLVLDTSELEVKLREARSSQIKTLQKYQEMLGWEVGTEMAKARRGMQKAESELESKRIKLEEDELLFSKGLISREALSNSRQQLESATTALISSREDLESTRQKGGPDNLRIARMELENAQAKLEEVEKQLAGAEIRAPFSGVVIRPSVEDDKKVSLERGARIRAGDSLLALGNLDGLRVLGKVDEVDIGRLTVGQKVRARGDAFPGITLTGHVAHISAQATGGTSHQAPTFDIQVTIPELNPEAEENIRVGMSADLEIQVHDNPEALLAPLPLVRVVGGKSLVRVVDGSGRIEEREVRTGMTTMDAVEITSGVQAGERLAEWPR